GRAGPARPRAPGGAGRGPAPGRPPGRLHAARAAGPAAALRLQKRGDMTAVETYRAAVLGLIRRGAEDTDPLDRASRAVARSLQDGGVLHVFGSGHSMLPAIDATFRAGGLAPVNLLHDPALAPWEPTRVSRIERLP